MTTHGLSYKRLYRIRLGMIQRCTNPKDPAYKNYGARGISVCREWIENPESFFAWGIAHGYEPGLTIERTSHRTASGRPGWSNRTIVAS